MYDISSLRVKIRAAKNKADLLFSTTANFLYYNRTLCNKDFDNEANTLYVNWLYFIKQSLLKINRHQ